MKRNKPGNKLGIFLIVLIVLITGGCAGNGDSEVPGPAKENTEEESEMEAETDIIEVEIRDFKYIPEELTVSVGQTVRWTNYDKAIHNVVGSGLDSQDMREGDNFTFIFEKAGTFDYICTYHPWMEGTVIVIE